MSLNDTTSSSAPMETASVYIIVNTAIFLNNLLVMLTYRQMLRTHQIGLHQLYMLALIGSDVICLAAHSVALTILTMRLLVVSKPLCDCLGFVNMTAVEITALIHSAMCVDRWYSVRAPVKYHVLRTKRKSRILVYLTILMCFCLPISINFTLYTLNWISFSFEPRVPACLPAASAKVTYPKEGLQDSSAVFVVGHIDIQTSTYGYMLRKLTVLGGVSRIHVAISFRTVLVTILSYHFCWLPIGVWLKWVMFIPDTPPPGWFVFISVQMIASNSATSFPIHYMTMRKFRKSFLTALCQTTQNRSD